MLERHVKEIAAFIYRRFIYPFRRLILEKQCDSILEGGSYVKNAVLEGKNFLGKDTAFRDGVLGYGSYINRGGDFTHTKIGKYTSIGACVCTAVGSHPTSGNAAMHPAFTDPKKTFGFSYTDEKTYDDNTPYIEIGNDVWIGNRVLILDGVKIGDGAVIGAGAVVSKDLPPYSINVGVPARTVRYRFTEAEIHKLLRLRWWDRDPKWIRKHIRLFSDVKGFTEKAEE